MFHDAKYQDKLSFTNNNQQATSSTNETGLLRRKLSVQVSQIYKAKCSKFHEEEIKKNKFLEDLNQVALSFLEK